MKKHLIVAVLPIVMLSSLNPAKGQLSFTYAVGGIPSVPGATLETFDEANPSILTLSGSAFLTTGMGGNGNGLWFPPYFSGGTAAYFGETPTNGYDSSRFVVVQPGGSATMSFGAAEHYFGIMIGSVDTGNTLTFYNGANVVGTWTGSEIPGPYDDPQTDDDYVNITSAQPFTSVVATYNGSSFEFDDVAYSPVPEPSLSALLGGGLVLVLGTRLRRRIA